MGEYSPAEHVDKAVLHLRAAMDTLREEGDERTAAAMGVSVVAMEMLAEELRGDA